MYVYAGNIRNNLQELIEKRRNFRRGHTRVQFLRFGCFVSDRLHRQMKHYLEPTAVRVLDDVYRMVVVGQNGNSEGITKSEDGFGCSAIVAEIVDNDCETRVRGFSAGILRFYPGHGCCARHDFDFECRQSCMAKLEVKQIPGSGGRVMRQMISGRDGIETLNELCDGGTVQVCRGIIF